MKIERPKLQKYHRKTNLRTIIFFKFFPKFFRQLFDDKNFCIKQLFSNYLSIKFVL